MSSESEISEGISENLLQAVSQGQVENVRKNLDNQCLSTDDLCRLLHYTASCGQVKVARLLINDYKCPVDCRNNSKETSLHHACHKGHLSLVRMLVSEHKADLNARDENNNAPVHHAAFEGHTHVVKCLIDEFSCSPSTKGYEGMPVFHQACGSGNVELVEMLLTKYNLDPLSVDDNGNTPLHIAALSGREEVANMLITKYKCPVDCRNNSKQTPLHHACSKGHLNIVRKLVSEHKADLNSRDKDNNAPVHHAALNFNKHTHVFKCLIDEFSYSPVTKGFKGRTAIHHACESENLELVEILLTKYNLNPFSVDDDGNTPLHIAASAGREKVVNMLITKYKCPVDCRNNSKQTPLHYACNKGHLSVVRMLVSEHKADLNSRNENNNTPLHHAAFIRHTNIVKCLIDEFSCSPDTKGCEGMTVIHAACYSGNVELVEMLLTRYNLDTLSVDDNGNTPLHIAALAGREEVVNMLITKYKCPVECRNDSKQTPLHIACLEGHLSVVRMLVSEHKADLNARDVHNNTPLNYAALGGHTNVVESLINEFSCSPYLKEFKGRTLFHLACYSGNLELVEMLYNMDPLFVDDNGDTPLHIAALAGREEVVSMLITKFKCPVDCRNNSKQTPLHIACGKGHLSVVRVLVSEHNADLNACDEHNTTPLNHAAMCGHNIVVKSLISEFSCSLYIKECKGRTLFHHACYSGNFELVEMLYNMDPLFVDDNGDTPLHIAALAGREEVVNLLITKYKCPVDCRNNSKQTPLHIACGRGHLSLVRMLASVHKADLNARDKENNTPLNKAALCGRTKVIKCLIDEFKCNPDTRGGESGNLLHQICTSDHEMIIKLLIHSYKLSLISADDYGNTPLHIAACFGSSTCLHTLLHNYNAPVFVRNSSGKTAVDVANNETIRNILQRYIQEQHKSIVYEYKEVQALSVKTYSGAQKLTRVFVVGNVESGKSTLIESLKREGFISSLNPVSEATVPPHTNGIIPSVHHSKTIGRVLYYDFAGDPEYYSSHSAIISNVMKSKFGTNIFLVVVNLTKDIQSIHDELGYWFSFISYNVRINKQFNVLLIGSHADLISKVECSKKIESMKDFEHSLQSASKIIDCLALNCRKPRSSKRVQSALLETIGSAPQHSLTSEGAILLGLLEKDFKDVVTCKLQTLLSHIKDTGIHLPKTSNSLYPFVEELHAVGLLMTIRRKRDKLEDCLLLLGISKLTNEVHKILFSDSKTQKNDKHSHGASMGILPHTYLKEILPEYISTDCLVQLQYCQEFSHAEVKFDHSIVPTEDPSAPRSLYFPALCTTERKKSIITPDDYTYSIGWFAECQSKFDYFPSRYLHVLLLRLAFSFAHPVTPCVAEGESKHVVDVLKSNCRCTMWKNGIHWHMEEGVECIVELVNNSKGLVVVTKSRIEEERKCKCTQMLFKIIDLAVQAKEEFCHSITLKQYLMPLDPKDTSSFRERDKLFDLRDVDRVLRERKPVVLSITGKQKVESSSLAHLKVHLLTGTWSSVISYICLFI